MALDKKAQIKALIGKTRSPSTQSTHSETVHTNNHDNNHDNGEEKNPSTIVDRKHAIQYIVFVLSRNESTMKSISHMIKQQTSLEHQWRDKRTLLDASVMDGYDDAVYTAELEMYLAMKAKLCVLRVPFFCLQEELINQLQSKQLEEDQKFIVQFLYDLLSK